jgi:hypothetical protein
MPARAIDSERKRRADAWEIRANLSDADQRKVFAWARSLGYGRALALIAKELKIEPPSMSAFAGWYEWFSKLESEERVHKAISDGAAISDLARSCGDVSEAMVAALESEASAAILSGEPDRIRLLVSLALKARTNRAQDKDIEIKLRKLDLLENQAAQAKARLEGLASKGGLTPETIEEIEQAARLL